MICEGRYRPVGLGDPAADGPARRLSGLERLAGGRPRYFPSVYAWLSVGIGRSWRGAAGALVGTWFYLPLAVFAAGAGAVVFGAAGFSVGLAAGRDQIPDVVADLPVLGAALDSFLLRSGGILAGLAGVLLGLLFGFLAGLFGPWSARFTDDPVAGAGAVVGVAAAGFFVGMLYTSYRVIWEPSILRVSGARRLSRREAALIMPVVRACTQSLGLSNHPPVLIDDSREPNAFAYTRHIVVNQGLLDEFQYDRDVIAGALCHELVHWRNGDPLSAAFVRGIALPLYLIHAGAGWLTGRTRHPFVLFGVWVVFWPVLLTVKYVIMPLQAVDTRRAEFRADQGAVLAGHRDGLRRVIARLQQSFEAGRNGWTRSVCASHPPSELRLERLEDPARSYPLPDQDRPVVPLPVAGASSLIQD